MGLLDWLLKPKSSTSLADAIWLNHEAKWNGLVREIKQRLAEGDSVLVAAHFKATFREATTAILEADVKCEPIQPISSSRELSQMLQNLQQGVGLVLAESLLEASALTMDESSSQDLPTLTLFIVERHSLPQEDDRLLRFAEQLPCRSRVRFMISFDDPFMQRFVSDSTRKTLELLGMKEKECIESTAVSRSIRQAQEKLLKRSHGSTPADSAEVWFEQNLPSN